jgi:hypothetical protein
LRVDVGRRDLRVTVLHGRERRLEDRDVAVTVAGRAAARHLRVTDGFELEEAGEGLLFTRDQQLIRDRLVIGALDALVGERHHLALLIAAAQEWAEVEADDALARAQNDRLNRVGCGGRARGVGGAGDGGDHDDERSGQQADTGVQTVVLSKRRRRVVSS